MAVTRIPAEVPFTLRLTLPPLIADRLRGMAAQEQVDHAEVVRRALCFYEHYLALAPEETMAVARLDRRGKPEAVAKLTPEWERP